MLCEPASKVLEFLFEPLHFIFTGMAVVLVELLPFSTSTSTLADEKANLPVISQQ